MTALPAPLSDWFARRGWALHPHQLVMLERAADAALLLVAPTGGGKTLAGFLPTLADLAETPRAGLHTLYISPLKALAADIRRNLTTPITEAGLPIRVEDRTGDTSQTARKRQRADPPHILLTTPESLALLISYEDAPRMFAGLQRVVVDEIHALAESKRGDQLMLCLSRLQSLAPGLRAGWACRRRSRTRRPSPVSLPVIPTPHASFRPTPAPPPTYPCWMWARRLRGPAAVGGMRSRRSSRRCAPIAPR
jgi:ATP-dependent helicase Lhr and Lhr-like helicase